MSEEPSPAAREEALHEFVDATLTLAEPLTPTQEQTLRDALGNVSGVKNVHILQQKIAVHYDPLETAREKITRAIASAGLRIAEAETTPSSPLTDARMEEQAPPAKESSHEE